MARTSGTKTQAMTAQAATAAFAANPDMAPVAISDTTANVGKYLDALELMARAAKITTVSLSDTRTMTISGAQFLADQTIIGMLPDRALMIVTGVLAADADAVQVQSRVRSFTLRDSSAQVAARLDALNNDTKLTSVTLTDSNPLAMSYRQLVADTFILSRLPSTATYAVSDVTTGAAATVEANARVVSFAITDTVAAVTGGSATLATLGKLAAVDVVDTAAQVIANLAELGQTPQLRLITVSDTDMLAITAAQYQAHPGVLVHLAPQEMVTVTDVAAAAARLVADDARVATVTVSDTLDRIGANLATLDALAESGELTAIQVTDSGGTLSLTAAEQAEYADAINLMDGAFAILPPRPPVINLVWDESVVLAPAGFKTAVEYAARWFDSLIQDAVTINIEVGWGEARDTALGAGLVGEAYVTTGLFRSFTDYRADLVRNNSSAVIQSAIDNLVDPGRQIFVPGAQAKALELMNAADTRIDGAIGFYANRDLYTYDPNNRAVAGKVDLIGLAQHELTHALGRVSYVWTTTGFDLYRYSAPGVWATSATDGTYFSIDGGQTNLGNFSIDGDPADWGPDRSTDVQSAFIGMGTQLTFSDTDIVALNALGYAIGSAGGGGGTGGVNEPVIINDLYGSAAHMAFIPPSDGGEDSAVDSSTDLGDLILGEAGTEAPVAPLLAFDLAGHDRMAESLGWAQWMPSAPCDWLTSTETL